MKSLDDITLELKARRANARLRRLEKFEKETGYGESTAQRLADFYLEDFGGRKRFPENSERLTEEQKDFLRAALSNFLDEETSTVRGYGQSIAMYGEVKDYLQIEEEEGAGTGLNPFDPEKDQVRYNQFWQLFNEARAVGLNKTFDYKTISQSISWAVRQAKGDQAIIDRIAKDINTISKKKRLTRSKLINTITRSRRKPGRKKK